MIEVPFGFKHATMFRGGGWRAGRALLAGFLLISSPVGAQPAMMKTADPYFTPTAAKTTTTMPRVIIRNIREDRAGNIWFATFGGPIRYDGRDFANFSEEVGLAKTRIFSLLEDRSGALWFGSITGGASRYDGKSFTKFTDKEGLGNNDVTWIFEDRDANIWFGTGNGASRYDGKSMINFTTKEGLVDNSVYAIAQDASGRVWFGTQGGICSYDGKSFSNLADQIGRSFVNVRAIVVDRSGNVWFGGQDGAFRFDGKTLTTFTSENGLLDGFVGSMIVDRAGNVWLGHPGQGRDGGASRFDGKTFKHFTKEDGLNSTNVYCMLEDKAGNIWFGSVDAGACRFDGKTFTNFSEAVPPSPPARPAQEPAHDSNSTIAIGETVPDISKSCWIVFQDKDDNYWLGSDGQGVCRFDGRAVTRFTTKDGLSHDQVRGIQQHPSTGDILITTNAGVSKFDGQRFVTLPMTEMKPPGSVALFNEGPNEGWVLNANDLWMSGSGGPRRYDGKILYQLKFPKSPHADEWYGKYGEVRWNPYDVWTVYRDRGGHMWFGTGGMGVCRFDGQSLDWMFEPHLTEVEGGGWFGFRSIIEDRNGDFWVCNTQFRYDMQPHGVAGQEAGKLKYTREKGMDLAGSATTDKFIYYQSITEDDNRDLWMAPYAGGVWKYDGKNVTHYPMKDGDKEITMFTIYKDNHGGLWVGTHEHGAYKFNGKTFERFRP